MPNTILYELMVAYPWIFWVLVILFLKILPAADLKGNRLQPETIKAKDRIPLTGKKHLFIAGLIAVASYWGFRLGYRYECQIVIEAVVPFVIALPYMKRLFTSFRMVFLVLLPLVVLVIFEQLKCTQFNQWTYLLSENNRYFFWAKNEGTIWQKILYFGGIDYPAIELFFYPLYIFGTLAIEVLALAVTPSDWMRPDPRRKWVFPFFFGVPFIIMIIGLVWFLATRHDLFPFHAVAACSSLLLMWVGYLTCQKVREITCTRLFTFGVLFSIAQTAFFEWYHCGIMGHWIYKPENELYSLHSIFQFNFPDMPIIGSIASRSWPVEEWCAYPTLFVFVLCYLVFFHIKLKTPVLKHEIVD